MSEPNITVTTPLLQKGEAQWIAENQKRCKACGHLDIFHHEGSGHYGDEADVCMVGDCPCRNTAMPGPARTKVRKGPPAFKKPSPDLVLHLKGEDVHCEWDKERGTYVEKP